MAIPLQLSTQHPPSKGDWSLQSPASFYKSPLLTQSISCPLLPVLLVSQISAASHTSQQQQHSWWLSHSSYHPDLHAGFRKHITGTQSVSKQLHYREGEVRFVIASHYFFSFLLWLFHEKCHLFPPWFSINFAQSGCPLLKTLQEQGRGAGSNHTAVLAAALYVSVCAGAGEGAAGILPNARLLPASFTSLCKCCVVKPTIFTS